MDIDVSKDIVDNSNFDRYVFCGGYGDAIYPKILEICEYMLSTDKFWLLETNGALPNVFGTQLMELPWRRRCGFIFYRWFTGYKPHLQEKQ